MHIKAGVAPALLLVSGFAVLSAACAGTPTHESTGQALDDSVITTKVKAALVADPATKARDIHVTTYRGVVQLSGFVNSQDERDDATRIARHEPGVRDVQDELQVSSSSTVGRAVDDSDITARVKAALFANPDSHGDIEVTTHEGEVQLYGFVNSNAQRDTAGKVAEGVQDVRKVDNALKIKPQG